MELYRVWHAKEMSVRGPGDEDFPDGYELVALVRATGLKAAFVLTNHIDETWWWTNAGVCCFVLSRSTLVDDVITDPEGRAFRVESIGFRELAVPADRQNDPVTNLLPEVPPTFSRMMEGGSRFELCGRSPHYRIVLGWDRPLHTYFAQVWFDEEEREDGALVLWVGTKFGQITSTDVLAETLKLYADLSEELCLELVRDKEGPTIELALQLVQSGAKLGRKED